MPSPDTAGAADADGTVLAAEARRMRAEPDGYLRAMWFDSAGDVLRIVLVGTSAYVVLVVLLRISGKRTLAKLNAFDFVVTIALGSMLATIVLDSRTSLTDGGVALFLLVSLQALVAAATARLPWLRTALNSRPSVLLVDGRPLLGVMRSRRVSLDEVRQAVRSTGTGDLADVAAVVLETDGTLSVISAEKAGDRSALPSAGVERFPEAQDLRREG